MTKVVLAVVLMCITAVVAKNIVCYYDSRAASYSNPTAPGNFSKTNCTHYIYDGIGVTPLGEIRILSSYDTSSGFADFQSLRKDSTIKLFVQLGSERDGSKNLTNAIAGRCEKLVNSVAIFLEQYNFDGVDVDRRTNDFDKGTLSKFVNRLRSRLYMINKQLSVSVSAQLIDAYDITSLSLYADMINFHAFNFTSTTTNTANLAPLFTNAANTVSVNSTLTSWLAAGARRNKINLVVASYGRTYLLADETQNGVGARTTGPGVAGTNTKRAGLLSQYEFCSRLSEFTEVTDAAAAATYYFAGKNWVSIETDGTLVQKYTFVLDTGLAGVGIYTLDLDDANNTCTMGAYRVSELAYQYFLDT